MMDPQPDHETHIVQIA